MRVIYSNQNYIYRYEVIILKSKYSEVAGIFKAFCDENRIRILELLKSGEKCGCKLLDELNVTQPTLSHHMKILCDSGIVESRKEGKWTHYKINQMGCENAKSLIDHIVNVNSFDNTNCSSKE